MILHRYHDIDYFLALPINDGVALANKAIEKETEERIFAQWAAQLPVMALTGEAVSFADYRDRMTGANIDKRPTDVIIAEIDEIEKMFEDKENKTGG